jgi:Fe-S-cluster-containing dehydrogenase component
MCVERLEKGEEPACVNACPTGALEFLDEDVANRTKRMKVAEQMVSAQEQQ